MKKKKIYAKRKKKNIRNNLIGFELNFKNHVTLGMNRETRGGTNMDGCTD